MEYMQDKILLAFDFDHTIITDNSDVVVQKLAPNGKLPQSIRDYYNAKTGWTLFMKHVFAYIFEHGVTPTSIQKCMEEIPLTNGMHELFSQLPPYFESIIISDSNSILIDYILKDKNLKGFITAVFTNSAKFTEEGKLTLEPFHHQDWCELSSKNLCKGDILEKYIAARRTEGVTFTTVAFVGDGRNDLCPSLRLREQDLIFPRVGYQLVKELQILQKNLHPIEAKVYPWESAIEIYNILKVISPRGVV
ncbi:PREDICTED: pyridoxal phosphate phosphatase PHOSPHO2-like isoform X2 [Priapulus caudatus]|uniref:Pyridoxal phosphate phosphatase PHOSPHO2-like isoform X2 n=1 Tax=Priapulus caudatus TaxID=37621 RepID=A0ABM1E1B9_PRICU|nr:PREDICTED: pyridoxal phosphate phosphatase PHOSPHO2-like isoform X2 [Priapulus caudatus]